MASICFPLCKKQANKGGVQGCDRAERLGVEKFAKLSNYRGAELKPISSHRGFEIGGRGKISVQETGPLQLKQAVLGQ